MILQVSVRKTKLFCSKDFSNFLANSISRISGSALTKDLGKFLGLNCSVPKTKLFCSKDVSNFLENTGSYYGEYAAKAVVPEDQLDMAVADMVENSRWKWESFAHLLPPIMAAASFPAPARIPDMAMEGCRENHPLYIYTNLKPHFVVKLLLFSFT